MDEQSHMGKFSKIRWAGIPTQSESSMGGDGNFENQLALGVCFQSGGGGPRGVTGGHGLMANTVPFPAVPPAVVVPYSTAAGLRAKPATGMAPSPFWPEKLCSTFSVQAPPGADGGVNSNTIPQPGIS